MADVAHSVTVKIDNAGGTLTAVGEIVAVNGPGMRKDTPEKTHMASASRHREFLSGFIDPGEIEVTVNYDPGAASDVHIIEVMRASASRSFEVAEPSGADKIEGECFVTAYNPARRVGDKMELTFTMKITGVPTFTAG